MRKWIAFFVILFFTASHIFGQTKEDLEKQKQQLLNQITALQSQLTRNKSSQTLSQSQIQNLQQQIRKRQQLIITFNEQIQLLDKNISVDTKHLISLQNSLAYQKKIYAELLYQTYLNQRLQNPVLFIFSSSDFSDLIRRILYLQRISSFRHAQLISMRNMQQQVQKQTISLKQERIGKTKLLTDQQIQKNILAKQQQTQSANLAQLQKQAALLQTQIAAKKKAQQKLDAQISIIIQREISAARIASAKSNKASGGTSSNATSAKSSSALTATPESMALSEGFANNRGNLPWPVAEASITEGFGIHQYGQLQDVSVKNNGVDMATTPGAQVRSIYKGTVSGIVNDPAFQYAVVINHGEYFSVYSHLENVSVKTGQQVDSRQTIGTAHTDKESGQGIVHLEIWEGTDLQDPQSWLAPK